MGQGRPADHLTGFRASLGLTRLGFVLFQQMAQLPASRWPGLINVRKFQLVGTAGERSTDGG